jgi:hypothetical protein
MTFPLGFWIIPITASFPLLWQNSGWPVILIQENQFSIKLMRNRNLWIRSKCMQGNRVWFIFLGWGLASHLQAISAYVLLFMCICTTPSCSGLSPLYWVFTAASTFCLAPSCRCFCHTLPIPHSMTLGCIMSWILFLFNMQGDIWLRTTWDGIHGYTALWCLQSDPFSQTFSFPSSLPLPP